MSEIEKMNNLSNKINEMETLNNNLLNKIKELENEIKIIKT